MEFGEGVVSMVQGSGEILAGGVCWVLGEARGESTPAPGQMPRGCTEVLRGVDGLVCLDEDVASMGSHQHQLLHERRCGGGGPGYLDDDILLPWTWGVHQALRNLGRDPAPAQTLLGFPFLGAKPWGGSWEKQWNGGPLSLPLGARLPCVAVQLAPAQGPSAKWRCSAVHAQLSKPPAEGAFC